MRAGGAAHRSRNACKPAPSPRGRAGAVQQPELHQVRLVDFFDRVFFLAERGGDRIQAHRAAEIFLDNSQHQVAVDFVEAVLVNAEHRERVARNTERDVALGAHFGEIADAAQQAIGERGVPRLRRAISAAPARPS